MCYILLAIGTDGGIKTLRSPAGFYSFKKKSNGLVYVTRIPPNEQMVRPITTDEESKLKKMDRVRNGGCLEDVFTQERTLDL